MLALTDFYNLSYNKQREFIAFKLMVCNRRIFFRNLFSIEFYRTYQSRKSNIRNSQSLKITVIFWSYLVCHLIKIFDGSWLFTTKCVDITSGQLTISRLKFLFFGNIIWFWTIIVLLLVVAQTWHSHIFQ